MAAGPDEAVRAVTAVHTQADVDRLVGQLGAALADLQGYIDRQAAIQAAPLIEDAERRAASVVATAHAETDRQRRVVVELRRTLASLEEQLKRANAGVPA